MEQVFRGGLKKNGKFFLGGGGEKGVFRRDIFLVLKKTTGLGTFTWRLYFRN